MRAPFSALLLVSEHTDFDRGAEAVALALARRLGVPLPVVMPVLSNPEFEMVAPQRAERAEIEVARRREALLALAQAQGVTLQVQVRRATEPHAAIVQAARLLGSELIVVRRRGQRGLLARLLVGEMVGRLLDQAPCSVLVAPRASQPWHRAVLAGVDPLALDDAMLRSAAALAAQAGLPLHVVAVVATAAADVDARRVLDEAARRCADPRVRVAVDCRVGPVAPELLAAASAHGADLVVLGRQRGVAAGRPRVGSVTRRVLERATGPVLVHVPAEGPPAA